MGFFDDLMDTVSGRVKCPECKSNSVTDVTSLTSGMSAKFERKNYKCNDCGHKWTARDLKEVST